MFSFSFLQLLQCYNPNYLLLPAIKYFGRNSHNSSHFSSQSVDQYRDHDQPGWGWDNIMFQVKWVHLYLSRPINPNVVRQSVVILKIVTE